MTVTSFVLSPAEVHVPGTEWHEPVLVWLSVNMPTGSSKSSLYQFLHAILTRVRKECGSTTRDPSWLLGDASCEKMGDLMSLYGGRLLGLYDELSTFLTQLNLYRRKGLNLTHELALFLQLYNGHPWTRGTGMVNQIQISDLPINTCDLHIYMYVQLLVMPTSLWSQLA